MANIVAGSTHHFRRTENKDGLPWNLAAATVQFRLKKPDGTVLTFTGSVLDGPAGIVQYIQSDPTVFSVVGTWSRSWLITDGAVIDPTPPISFVVIPAP